MFEARFRGFGARVSLLVIFGAVAISSLFWFHELYIQFILIVWNVVILLFIIFWEKEKRRRQLNFGPENSEDEKWVNANKELEHIQSRLGKTRDPAQRKALLSRQLFLRNEIRRLEWSIREANLNEIFNAQKNILREIDPKRTADKKSDETRDSNQEALGDASEKAQKKDDECLERIINDFVSIVNTEPAVSLPTALKPLANELRAHYNIIKQKDPYSASASNFWAVWALAYGLAEQSQIDARIVKYTSKTFRFIVYKLIRAIDARATRDSMVLIATAEDNSDSGSSSGTTREN